MAALPLPLAPLPPLPAPPRRKTGVADLRFRALLTREDWQRLPEAVRARFSHRLDGGATAIFAGRVHTVRRSAIGRMLAGLMRVVGAPLPLHDDEDVPSVISVTEDALEGGQVWSRLYANRSGVPQIIHSAKRFQGPTGLEEHIGAGIVMRLRVGVEDRDGVAALVFRDAGYAWRVGRLSIPIPGFLHPGRVEVVHRDRAHDLGPGRFTFSLTLAHAHAGELIHQAGDYADREGA